MFDLFDRYIDQMRPAAVAAAAELRAYGDRIINELCAIRDAVTDDDNVVFFRKYPSFNNLTVAGVNPAPTGNSTFLFDVPMGEEWEIEYGYFRPVTGAPVAVMLYRNGNTFAATPGGGSGSALSSASGLRLQPGDVVGYELIGGGASTVTGFLQVRVAKPKPSRNVNNAPAWENPTATVVTTPGNDDVAGQQTLPRHTGTYFQGVSPVGEGRARANGTL